jgi:hypothetical protein
MRIAPAVVPHLEIAEEHILPVHAHDPEEAIVRVVDDGRVQHLFRLARERWDMQRQGA